MYILRPVLRASLQRPPARLISGRRFGRSRHQTRLYSSDPSTPGGTDGKPIVDGSDGAPEKKKGAEEAVEPNDDSATAEDPELLAQSIQRSREMTRRYSSALRRTQRRNRVQDLPPVVVPKWFLEERIVLQDELVSRPPPLSRAKKAEIMLSLKREDEKDLAQCSIPISDPSVGVQLLTQWVSSAWQGEVLSKQNKHFAKSLAAQWGLGNEQIIVDALERGGNLDSVANKLREPVLEHLKALKIDLARTNRLLDSSEVEHLIQAKRKHVEADTALMQSIRSYEALAESKNQENKRQHVSPFTLAEIRATMAASLSALQPAINHTFPSARTNLILHTPLPSLDGTIHETVRAVASDLGADLIEICAQDLAELGGNYLGEGSPPSPHSIRTLGYETYRLSSELGSEVGDVEDLEASEQEEEEPPANPFSSAGSPRPWAPRVPMVMPLSILLKNLTQGAKIVQPEQEEQNTAPTDSQGRVPTQAEIQLEDLKISNLLENLIESINMKRSRSSTDTRSGPHEQHIPAKSQDQLPTPNFFDFSIPAADQEVDLFAAIPRKAASAFDVTANVKISQKPIEFPESKIIYVQDFKELTATHYGSRIIQKLEEIVRKRRSAGERIMIVGSTCSRDLTPESSVEGVQDIQADGDSGLFRSIVVPAETLETFRETSSSHSKIEGNDSNINNGVFGTAEKRKFSAINMRHIQNMLYALDPHASRKISRRPASNKPDEVKVSEAIFPRSYCSRVMTHDEVHRVALTTLGLHLVDPACDALEWTHVALAMSLLKASDEAKFSFVRRLAKLQSSARAEREASLDRMKDWVKKSAAGAKSASAQARESQLETISSKANQYEKRLMPGIVNPEQIKVGFDQVHVQSETVDAIRTLTSMSFLRPDAFNYGVLATEKISGALLYGPPGTGKTLLAKAVAKESGCAVLEVSGSQIHDKYVGEGEKNVTAIFSLARKLSPCIVFLDEADAVLSSRDSARERASARDILNQFLKEWDGLNHSSVFVMVATNRPFDLDDAVIRRLPRRLLVDLPTEADRKEILKIHLRGEQLDESVDLSNLAQQTPFYSGSDLKNVAVAAALACVKEENEQAIIAAAKSAADNDAAADDASSSSQATHSSQLFQGVKYDFPQKRTLSVRHFDKAIQEISASVSEDMSSLNAIKKFDEKYGDKKGKKKKRVFGIGPIVEASEASARVRS